MRTAVGLSCLLFALSAAGSHGLAAAPATVAVVMQERAEDTATPRVGLRLAFVKSGKDWRAVCSSAGSDNASCGFTASAPSQWTVLWNGKMLATIVARGWRDNATYSERGMLRIVSDTMPRIADRKSAFAGWAGTPVSRPLVALNAAGAVDGHWSELHGDRDAGPDAVAAIRKLVGPLPDCRADPDRESKKTRPITRDDIHLVEHVQAANDVELAGAALKPRLVQNCDYTSDLQADAWFVKSAAGAWKPLAGLAADETTHALIDMGDFAGDGQTEALFWRSGYDADGFVLYYDDFNKYAAFTWTYH